MQTYFIERLKVKTMSVLGFNYLDIKQNRLKTKSIARNKEVHFDMLSNSIEQEDMLMLNLYTQ